MTWQLQHGMLVELARLRLMNRCELAQHHGSSTSGHAVVALAASRCHAGLARHLELELILGGCGKAPRDPNFEARPVEQLGPRSRAECPLHR